MNSLLHSVAALHRNQVVLKSFPSMLLANRLNGHQINDFCGSGFFSKVVEKPVYLTLLRSSAVKIQIGDVVAENEKNAYDLLRLHENDNRYSHIYTVLEAPYLYDMSVRINDQHTNLVDSIALVRDDELFVHKISPNWNILLDTTVSSEKIRNVLPEMSRIQYHQIQQEILGMTTEVADELNYLHNLQIDTKAFVEKYKLDGHKMSDKLIVDNIYGKYEELVTKQMDQLEELCHILSLFSK